MLVKKLCCAYTIKMLWAPKIYEEGKKIMNHKYVVWTLFYLHLLEEVCTSIVNVFLNFVWKNNELFKLQFNSYAALCYCQSIIVNIFVFILHTKLLDANRMPFTCCRWGALIVGTPLPDEKQGRKILFYLFFLWHTLWISAGYQGWRRGRVLNLILLWKPRHIWETIRVGLGYPNLNPS